jgi:hypothetical protein
MAVCLLLVVSAFVAIVHKPLEFVAGVLSDLIDRIMDDSLEDLWF